MYLLDTVVLSELRRKERNPNVVSWIEAVPPASAGVGVELADGVVTGGGSGSVPRRSRRR